AACAHRGLWEQRAGYRPGGCQSQAPCDHLVPDRGPGDSGGRLPWAAGGSDVEHALVQRPTA
ncbi:unnamed protein product, partial [Effrenium voratum]